MSIETIRNLAGAEWFEGSGNSINVENPATGETIAVQPSGTAEDANRVIGAAAEAFWEWRMTPVPTRASILFRYRELVHSHTDELAETIVQENGKTLAEAKGELLRALQYIEHACAIPELMKGATSEEIGTGVDIEYIREPLGVFGIIAPFNFPAMIPLYFTWAVATGNTVVIKPSELTPLTAVRLVELALDAGFPPGVVNLALGGPEVVSAISEHQAVAGVSFVGSSRVAEIVYKQVTGEGKRCQSQGGSKNHLVVTDSAVLDRCMPNIVSSMFGNSSQRCFAGSNLLVYRNIWDRFLDEFLSAVKELQLGSGMDPDTTMGPIISAPARERLIAAVDEAVDTGGTVLLDGRDAAVEGFDGGHWLGPTVVEAKPGTALFSHELFGPVRCVLPVEDLDEAIGIINNSTYGHTAAVYTEQGAVARKFRQYVQVGQVGVNIGTPAPIAFYAVGGRKTSLFGSHRGRANDAVDFYTDKKVIVSTWHGSTGPQSAVDPAFEGRSA